MPFTNFESRHFTPDEVIAINDALSALESALSSKLANLTTKERQQYGSINEQNKLVVNKVREYQNTQPALSSPDVDWGEFGNDYNSRELLESVIQRLEALQRGTTNAKILHDWDNYKAALIDYKYTKYKNDTAAAGYETKANELAQFFSTGPNANSNTEDIEEQQNTETEAPTES